MACSVLDAGDCLMLSGESQKEVDEALAKYVERGAKVITQAVAVGSRWTGACTLPVRRGNAAITDRLKLSDVRDAASRDRTTPDMQDGCRVEAVGFKRIFTSASKEEVISRVQDFTRLGASLIGDIVSNGDEWVGIIDTRGAAGTGGPDEAYRW